jgi:hypothetical protein
MSKHKELNLKFYKKADVLGEPVYTLDASNAAGDLQRLYFINTLPGIVIRGLINTIDEIQNNQLYDPDFLTSAEEFNVFSVEFSNPYFSVEGYQTIHMDDL